MNNSRDKSERLEVLALQAKGQPGGEDIRLLPKSTKIKWTCGKNHSWTTTISSRVDQNTNCPYCSGRLAESGVNDLATTHPNLAVEFHPVKNSELNPAQIKAGSGKVVWWICQKGHEWKTSPVNRSRRGDGCPRCSGRYSTPGVNDLKTTRPDLAREFDIDKNAVDVESLMTFSTIKVYWLCLLGHSYKASVQNRTARGSNCPVCAGTQFLAGFNDFGYKFPHFVDSWNLERNDCLPSEVTAGSNRRVWWKCELGHEWQTSPKNRIKGGCPVCSGKAIWPGFNDLPTVHPDLMSEWDFDKNGSIAPSRVGSASNIQIWWTCEFGHGWKTKPAIRVRGSGCPTCNSGGFDPNNPAVLYFLRHKTFQAYKIGIMNASTNRLKHLSDAGWQAISTLSDDHGSLIRELETRLFSWIRHDKELPIYFAKEDMISTGGYTETFSAAELSENEVQRVIDQFYNELKNERK